MNAETSAAKHICPRAPLAARGQRLNVKTIQSKTIHPYILNIRHQAAESDDASRSPRFPSMRTPDDFSFRFAAFVTVNAGCVRHAAQLQPHASELFIPLHAAGGVVMLKLS